MYWTVSIILSDYVEMYEIKAWKGVSSPFVQCVGSHGDSKCFSARKKKTRLKISDVVWAENDINNKSFQGHPKVAEELTLLWTSLLHLP